jgi:putative spermidine/putrescine transport system substrate-binding protein
MKSQDRELIRDLLLDFEGRGITRRRFLQAGGVAGLTAFLAACGGGDEGGAEAGAPGAEEGDVEVVYDGGVFDAGGETLRVAQWGGFWEDFERQVLIDQFERDFNCQVSYDATWPWFPKFVAGGPDNPPYDVSHWNLPELYKTAAAGDFFESTDAHRANIPNAADVWDFAFPRYGIITLFSRYGYVYRTDLVDPPIAEFDQFWEDRLDNRRGTYITSNSLQHVFFMAASKWFGESEEDKEAGFEAMRNFMPGKISDFTGNMQTLYERGEVWAAVQNDAEVNMGIDRGIELDFYYWEHWKPVLTQTDVVSKGANETRKRLAYAWMNRKFTPEWQQAWMEQQYFRPTLETVEVTPNLAEKGVENTADALEGLVIPDWDWWNENEQEIVQEVNTIFAQ